jgi:transposase, IS5 family
MVGLSYLQHAFRLSDEEVVARWVDTSYWQYFCGIDYLQLELPIDPNSLVRRRQRIGQDGIELLLQETIAVAQRGKAAKPQIRASSGSASTPRCSQRRSRLRMDSCL